MEARSRLFRRTDVAITPYCTRHSGGSQSPVKAGRSPAPPCRGVRDPLGARAASAMKAASEAPRYSRLPVAYGRAPERIRDE